MVSFVMLGSNSSIGTYSFWIRNYEKEMSAMQNLIIQLRDPGNVYTSLPWLVVEFVVDVSKFGGAFSKIHVGGRSLAQLKRSQATARESWLSSAQAMLWRIFP
jgi:hypothetical protein